MRRLTLSKLDLELVKLSLEALEDTLEPGADILPRIAIEDLKVKILGE